MWLPKKNSNSTIILNLNNGTNEYNIQISSNTLMELSILNLDTYKDLEDIKNNEIIILNEIPPIHFYDVDFDGKKEFLIENAGGWNDGIFYEAYKIYSNSLEKMTGYPFTELNPTTKFDTINKTFTNTFSWGGSWYTYIYKQKKYQYMNINTSVNFYREIKSKTIELAKASPKALNRSLKCCQNRMIKHKKKY